MELLKSCKNKLGGESLVTITDDNNSTWRRTCSILNTSPESILMTYVPGFLKMYQRLPENSHTALPPSDILGIMAKYLRFLEPPTDLGMVLVQEMVSERLSREQSMQMIRDKNQIKSRLMDLLKEAERANQRAEYELERACDVLRKVILIYKQAVETRPDVVDESEDLSKFWSRWVSRPTISWLLDLPFRDARDFEDSYQTLDYYIQSMRETWTMLTYYWGAAAFSPRCKCKQQDKICGDPLIHRYKGKQPFPRCSQRIRRGDRDEVCNGVAMWGCFRKDHEMYCKDCLQMKQTKICSAKEGRDSSTDIYNANIRNSSIVGESLLLLCDNLLSRHPPSPDHPIKWKTTYRLQPAQLVAIIPLISRNDGLERDHRIFWGEVVTLPNSKVMESNLRKDGKINIRLLGKQDCDLFEDFGLVVGDAQFRSGASIAIVDLRVFVPEVMSVLATMNTKNFEIGLAQASFKPLLLNSVTARMDNIPPNLPLRNMIQYGLQNSTISTVRQLSQEKLEELANELWKIEQIRSLDATQGKSFAMALMHSLHTCQGPPGSGKSYVGVCIVLALSQIRQFAKRELNSNLGPIVVLAYKNHALDEFLLDVLDADASLDKSKGKGRLIRLGKPDEEALLEYTETKNREEFEAQKELEKRLELVKQVKTFMKEISVSMMADFVQAELYLRCLQMVEIINECENPSSIDAYNLLQKVCSDDLWVENTEEYAVELLETTEHILVRGIRRSIRTLSPNECLIKFNDIWKRWVKGEKLPPRCMGRCLVNEGNNNNNNKKKKQHQEQEEEKIDVQQCFNCASTFSVYCQEIHRCQFDQNLSSACIAARLDGNKALYCGLHTCSAYLKDKCSARKISEDISYCNVHSCPLCFEFKESTDLACISHQCQFPGCCGSFLVKSDLEYFSFCSNHCCKLCFQDNTMDDNSCKRPNSLFCDQHVCSLYPNCTESKFPGQDFCRNHLCRYCMGKVCNDSLFCQSHKCIEENCVSAKVRLLNVHGSKIPLDFCQLHACAVCATERVKGIGTNKICMATSSRQTCDNHFLCSGFLPNGNECSCVVTAEQSLCPEHSLGANTCGGVTNKKTKCKSRAIPGTGFCKDHQNQNKTQVIRGEQHLCFESNRLFEVIPMPNIVEPPYQHATSNRLVKYRHAKCTVEKLSPKGQPNWYCVLHGKVEEALNKTSVSDPSTELNVQPTTSRFVSSGITASNVSERSNIKNETNYELASSDDEDAKEVVNDARYIQGTANPDEMEVFEEEGYDDDDEAAGTQHNREIYQAEEDELDAFVMTEEADDIHEIFEANEFVVSSFNEEAANYYFALLKKLTTFDWTISAEERQRLVNDFFSFSIQFLRLLLRYADGYIEDARRLRAEASGRVLKRATVIGGTIVGAAKRLAALRAAEPFAVIVEEACEVLEPTLISVLSVPSLKKLELIGDHRQLPAFVNQYWYNVEMTRPKIKKSLFERIVLGVEGQQGEDHPVCTILNVQRRMRTSISALTKPEYEDVVQLIDHSCTAVQKIGDRYEKEDVDFKHIRNLWQDGGRAVPGMQSNIFFWDLQENKESKATVGLSACNENEAMAVTQLVSYFHHVCKVPLECITIITPYQGQKRVLVEKLRDVSLLPRPLHHKESDNKAKGKMNVAIITFRNNSYL